MTQASESWPWAEARYQGAEQRSSCPWTGGGFPGSCCCFFPPEWEVGDVHPPRAPCGKGTCRGGRELGQWSHAPSCYRSPVQGHTQSTGPGEGLLGGQDPELRLLPQQDSSRDMLPRSRRHCRAPGTRSGVDAGVPAEQQMQCWKRTPDTDWALDKPPG